MTDLLATPHDLPLAAGVDELDGTLVCAEITTITADVKSFTFALPVGSRLRFLPGQYVTFGFDIAGTHVERCYTISTPPTRDNLTITVKRVSGGVVSNWLHDRLRVGDTAKASGPFGQFSYAWHPASRYLFLTAGSGITPAMSMLRTLCDTADGADITFVHSACTPADIIFRDELESLAARHGVNLAVLCGADSPGERWDGRRGRLTLPQLLSIAPDLLEREIFTCGPPGYMDTVRGFVDMLGIAPQRYHEESFLLGGQQPVAAAADVTHHRVEFRRSGTVIDCDSATPILDAAAQAGLALPASCGEGVCGTCKTQRVSGSVEMRHAGGIRPREIDQGKVLLCCSTPESDIVLEALFSSAGRGLFRGLR